VRSDLHALITVRSYCMPSFTVRSDLHALITVRSYSHALIHCEE